MIELSKLGIPTVCVVFGSSTAGGAYQPEESYSSLDLSLPSYTVEDTVGPGAAATAATSPAAVEISNPKKKALLRLSNLHTPLKFPFFIETLC